ncbi:MAG: hypothetical protein QOJ02_1131 [Acidobacteriota bacterium]|jgi:hypothetical protein|nr:hypothetical protein [Acidobacteriota bacterium]
MKIHAITKNEKLTISLLCLALVFLSQGCSYQEAISGKHENLVGSHQITIMKPCRLFTENTTRVENHPEQTKYEYTCGDTSVSISLKDEELIVNEKSYGTINKGDSIIFDHGKVLINSKEVQEVASK